jgi:D-alanyl-D-alanine carboxypeptidase
MALALAAGACLLAACGSGSGTAAAPAGAALQQQLDHLVAMPGGPPGAIATVQIGNRVRTETAGVGDTAGDQPITLDDTFRIASVSKAYNGAVALALVSQGRLSLDDTIGKWLPDLPRSWWPVTLAQLLQHTSGVPDYITSPAFVAQLKADPTQYLSPTQILGFVTDEPLAFEPPGSRYEYSDSENIVVGLMAEAAAGATYDALLHQEVYGPLGLTATSLPDTVDLPEPYVRGYDVEAGQPPTDVSLFINPALAWASGGMIATPAELNTFIRAYARGALVDPSTRARQRTWVAGESGPAGPGTNSAGLGIYRYRTSCGTLYGATGNYPGYTTFAAATPDGSRSTVVMVNTQVNTKSSNGEYAALRQAWSDAACDALGR